MRNRSKLANRVRERYGPCAVVTGASSGIGRAMATWLAGAGLDLVLVARRRELLVTLARELEETCDVTIRIVPADLSTVDGLALVERETASLDVGLLIAAAGFGTSGSFTSAPLARELEMLDVNCRATLVGAHTFARRFVSRGRGGIVLLASLVGFQGTPYAAHYAATKAYVQSLAEALYVELRPHGVDVVAAAPGPTRSGFAERADMRMTRTIAAGDVVEPTLAALGRRATALPGLLTKVLTYSLAPLPRQARVRILGRVMANMTAHQRASSRRS